MRGSLEAHAIARDVASSSPSKATSALDVMRYQRLSPDCLPLTTGTRKPTSRSCKDDADAAGAADSTATRLPSYSPLEAKPIRARPPPPPPPSSAAASPSNHHHFPLASDHPPPHSDTSSSTSSASAAKAAATDITGVSNTGAVAGDVLLQWGHNKRSRGRRDAAAVVGDSPQRRPASKIQRRVSAPPEKLMPPPATAAAGGSYTRGANLRAAASFPSRDNHHHHRSVDERLGGGVQSRAEKRSPDKFHKAVAAEMHPDTKHHHHPPSDRDHHHHHDPTPPANGTAEKLNLEHFEWPRIYIALSRKEKEDDFLAMKGTKLPQRPKKRAKNVDKTLQYVFPGMWLSDLTRGRYEVREKKCVKKKRRGLKGMESMESESD